jgi:hypothetical protein
VRPAAAAVGEADLARLVEVGRAQSAAALLACVDGVAQSLLGHRMATVMRLHPDSMELERLYTSAPDAYPAGGRKSKRGLPWTDRVLIKGEVFIGADAAAMAWAFDDHEKLARLGLGSVINTPVLVAGRCVGTLNLLHEPGWYRPGDERVTTALAWLIAPVLQAAS